MQSGISPWICRFCVVVFLGATAPLRLVASPVDGLTAGGGTIIVMNANSSGPGSLLQAIADVPTGGTIEFDETFFGVPRTIPTTGSEFFITRNMTINGRGAHLTTLSGGGQSRVFRVTATVTIRGFTITDGAPGLGNGSGVSNVGTLTIRDCVITGNSGTFGGGLSNTGAGVLTVENSTVSNNVSATRGGGIDSTGVLNVVNSTISGNRSNDQFGNTGGGIWTRSATITNSTITNNTATGPTSAGGIYRDSGSLVLVSTIVAGNSDPTTFPSVFTSSGGGVSSDGYNLIGNRGTLTFQSPGDQSGTSANPLDPLLSPLALNGGTTPTHALRFGSPALDQGINFGYVLDQRGTGFPRPVDLPIANPTGGDGSDVGAYEAQFAPLPLATISGRVATPTGIGLRNAVVVMTDPNGVARIATTSSFGIFTFNDVTAGVTYIFSVRSKRYRFSPQTLPVNGNLANVDFTGLE